MNHPILLIAAQEFTINRRNKWIAGFSVIFILLTFLTSFFGMVTSGYSGFQDFARTATGLINITCFIVPLFALLLGVFSFISNKNYLEILASQPISRFSVLFGKYLGMLFTLFMATIIGFCIPGVVISLSIGVLGAMSYFMVLLYSLFLGAIFLAIAIFVSLLSRRQQIALGLAIGIWLFFEVFFGLLVLGSTLYFSPAVLKTFLLFCLLANPVDIVRVSSLLSIGGAAFFGPAGATLLKLTGSQSLAMLIGIAGLLLWLSSILLASAKIFTRQNL